MWRLSFSIGSDQSSIFSWENLTIVGYHIFWPLKSFSQCHLLPLSFGSKRNVVLPLAAARWAFVFATVITKSHSFINWTRPYKSFFLSRPSIVWIFIPNSFSNLINSSFSSVYCISKNSTLWIFKTSIKSDKFIDLSSPLSLFILFHDKAHLYFFDLSQILSLQHLK